MARPLAAARLRTFLALCVSAMVVMTAGANEGLASPEGQVREFSPLRGTSGPYDIVVGPDGALWFTEAVESAIGRVTTDGVVTQFPTLTPGAGSSPGVEPGTGGTTLEPN
jgi:streptogramin lyase